MSDEVEQTGKARVISISVLAIALIAFVDWRIVEDIPLGFLYLIPMLMLGRVLKPWQTVIAAGVLTFFTEQFDPFAWDIRTGMPRDVLYFTAFLAIGIYVNDATRNRGVILKHLREIERQIGARRDAEEQLHLLIESSPAAIVMADSDGCVLMANETAHRMFRVDRDAFPGQALRRFLPALSSISRGETGGQMFRAVMQSRGVRVDGETFVADISFSTYRTQSGARLAAMILDTSEELRSREESSLHQMLAGSRIAVAAVSHEIRNVCGAIGVVHQNLLRSHMLEANKDFEALGHLVLALEKIAEVDLRQYPETHEEVDLGAVLEDLKIVIAPSLEEAAIACEWRQPVDLPTVWADRTNLLQVFLNLTNNSIRALSRSEGARSMTIEATARASNVLISVRDTGGGVAYPGELFHPFQAGAHATGLGLYLSRSFARAFGGDLRYEAMEQGACFIVELPIATQLETA